MFEEGRKERISRILQSKRQKRERLRKFKYYLMVEEERQQKLHEEEEARKREEAERRKKEEAERLAKLAEIAEKQRQREQELEEKKERQRREALLGRPTEPASRPSEPPARPLESGSAAPSAAAAAPAPGKYVPRFRREKADGAGAPPPEPDRWTNSTSKPDGDKWRSDERRTAFGSGGGRSSSAWSSSRNPRDR